MSYHPWRTLRRLPGLSVGVADLRGAHGRYYPDQSVILLDHHLTQAQRRCTLAHELVHAEERHAPTATRWHGRRQERRADRIAAHRLITLDALVSGLLWSMDEHELADELWVDVDTVRARLASLTEEEHAEITRRVYDEERGL